MIDDANKNKAIVRQGGKLNYQMARRAPPESPPLPHLCIAPAIEMFHCPNFDLPDVFIIVSFFSLSFPVPSLLIYHSLCFLSLIY